MKEIALHLLDIAENSVAANAKTVILTVEEDLRKDRLKLAVDDNGKGMDESFLARVADPFCTTRTTRRVGLGIPLLKEAAEACNGNLYITSAPGLGTHLQADFQRSHIDRMPLGDLSGTMLTLVVAYSRIHWVFTYRASGVEFVFDDAPIKRELRDVPMTEPTILTFIREMLEEGVAEVQNAIEKAELTPVR